MVTRRDPRSRTACDRCYELKERCQRQSPSSQCGRCARLDLACATVRPVRPVGRKKRQDTTTSISLCHDTTAVGLAEWPSASAKTASYNASLLADAEDFLAALPELDLQEKTLLRSLFHQPESPDERDTVLKTGGISTAELLLLQPRDPQTGALLRDVLLASVYAVQERDSVPALSYIARATSLLRDFQVSCNREAAACQYLGSMLAYSIYSVIGMGVFQVSQYCLGQTESVFLHREQGCNGAAADPVNMTMDSTTGQSFLVMLEIMDCLLNRTQPTPLRILSPYSALSQEASLAKVTSFSLDPHLGLCVPLLRHYHRLCSISNLLLDTSDLSTISSLYDQLTTIHYDAKSWRPPALRDLIHNMRQTSQPELDTAQVIHLLAQAKLYRLGILLMTHRLRHPFGDEHHDRLAAAWSSEILSELDTAYTVTGGQRVQFVTMPFIIAAVEITEKHHLTSSGFQSPRDRALRALDEQVDKYAPALKAAVRLFLKRIWAERDATPVGLSWFDSVHKPCPVIESIHRDLGIPVSV